MITDQTLVTTERQDAAVIRFVIPREEIQTVMGPAMQEVVGAVKAQGIAPTGPMFSYHFRIDPDVFDFVVGITVERKVEPMGRVEPHELPAASVARGVYRGPYEGLGAAWGEFCDWIEAAGHTPAAGLWERYLTGPDDESGPVTELNMPLLAQQPLPALARE